MHEHVHHSPEFRILVGLSLCLLLGLVVLVVRWTRTVEDSHDEDR